MHQSSSGLVLISWHGWSVTGSIAALLILLITILLWLLPFPSSAIPDQLSEESGRNDLRGRLGAAPAFTRILTAAHRFDDWLQRWFGKRWSGQAFERCVAIAFVFPVALFLLATVLAGYKDGEISFGELLLFLFGVVIFSIAVRALFHLGFWTARRMWRSIGGDSELAEIITRILLGAFAVVFAFAIAFAVASSLAGEASNVGTVAFALLGGFAFAFAFAIAFIFAGVWAFVVALVLVTIIALTMAKDFAFFLLLFFVILPILNALTDWVSWAVTRFNLAIIERALPGPAGVVMVAGAVAADIVKAIALVVALTALLPIGLELADLILSIFGRATFDWRTAAAQAVQSPWEEGLFVTGMLLTPLAPTIAMITIGLASFATPWTPGAQSAISKISEHPEAAPAIDEIRQVSRIIYLSRLWYLPALLIGLGVFFCLWLALSLSGVPVAKFLETLALCSTVWGHGQCAWL